MRHGINAYPCRRRRLVAILTPPRRSSPRACRQPVPLRHPWPHHPLRASFQPNDRRRGGGTRTVRGGTLSRRPRRIVVAFTLVQSLRRTTAGRHAGQPQWQPACSTPGCASPRRRATVCTGKGVELGQGMRHCASRRSRRGNSNLPLRACTFFRRHRKTPNTASPPAASRSRSGVRGAVRLSVAEVRASSSTLSGASASAREAPASPRRRGPISAGPTAQVTYGELARDGRPCKRSHREGKPKPPSAPGSSASSIAASTSKRCPAKFTCGVRICAPKRVTCGYRICTASVSAAAELWGALEGRSRAPKNSRAMPAVVAVVLDGSFLGGSRNREAAIRGERGAWARRPMTAGPAARSRRAFNIICSRCCRVDLM